MGDGSNTAIKPAFTRIDGLEIRYATSPKIGAPTVLLTCPWPESIFS